MNWATMTWFDRWQLMGKPNLIIVSDKTSEVIFSTDDYDVYANARKLLEKAEAEFSTFVEFN